MRRADDRLAVQECTGMRTTGRGNLMGMGIGIPDCRYMGMGTGKQIWEWGITMEQERVSHAK